MARLIDRPDAAAIDWITDTLLLALTREERIGAPAMRFLLRRYAVVQRDDLRDALESALARALDERPHVASSDERAAWLTLFGEAAVVSHDERLQCAAIDLIAGLRAEWGRAGCVDEVAASIDACLTTSDLFEVAGLVQDAIDELERVIGAVYRPGQGVGHSVDEPSAARDLLSDHVRCASALLTAYSRTGRLPYSMLAEELIQFAHRTLWDERTGGFQDRPRGTSPFALNCEAARVLCRLAALHRDDGYRKAAVIASDADYLRDAARTLVSQASVYRQYGPLSALYGLALSEWLVVRQAHES